MVRVLTFMMLIMPLVSDAQTDSTGLIVTPHLATPFGKPVDKAVTVKMNKEGGTIKSGDGRVELIIPEGALSSKTNISIQPITNHAAGGVGNGYEFSPSGIKFNKPVQLIMHYKEHELEGTQARFKNIATQHKDGKWYKLKTSVDTITHSIVSSISHFSSYVTFDEITISPKQAKLKVGREVNMVVTFNNMADLAEGELSPLPSSGKFPPIKWFVNGIPTGNAVTGIIRVANNQNSKYYAPATVPDANPVAVTADLKGISFKDNVTGKTFKDLTLVSNITIYDKAYQISILGSWGVADDDLEKITDTSSFILHLNGNKNTITDIQNMFEVTIKNMPGCTSTYMNEVNATGVIHISGIESITVVPADPPRQPGRRITIRFKKPQIIMPDIHIKCKGAWINNELMSALLEDFKMGFPWTISFMENELKDKWATEAGIEEYQVKIRPLTED